MRKFILALSAACVLCGYGFASCCDDPKNSSNNSNNSNGSTSKMCADMSQTCPKCGKKMSDCSCPKSNNNNK